MTYSKSIIMSVLQVIDCSRRRGDGERAETVAAPDPRAGRTASQETAGRKEPGEPGVKMGSGDFMRHFCFPLSSP